MHPDSRRAGENGEKMLPFPRLHGLVSQLTYTQIHRLRSAAAHLEAAQKCLDGVTGAPEYTPGHLDLIAKTHIASAAAVLETALHTEEKTKRAGAR